MLYDTGNPYKREQFMKRAEKLAGEGRLVDLTDATRRSTAQNAYLHVCIGIVAAETGNSSEYVKEKYFKELVNPGAFITGTDTDPFTGRERIRTRSTAEIPREELSAALDRFKKWAAEQGWYIPDPGEYAIIRQAMADLDRMGKFIK